MIWKTTRIALVIAVAGLGLTEASGDADSDRARPPNRAGALFLASPSSPSAVPGKNCQFRRGVNLIRQFRICVKKNNWNNGNTRDGNSAPQLTPDGRFVVFTSLENLDLHPDDVTLSDETEGGGMDDVFLLDLQTGNLRRVSVDAAGRLPKLLTQQLPNSESPAVSANGRLVAFATEGAFLPEKDTNDSGNPLENDNLGDIYLKDLQTGELTLVSANSGGTAAGGVPVLSGRTVAMSDNGRFVAFLTSAALLPQSDGNTLPDAYVKDLDTNRFFLVSVDSQGEARGDAGGGIDISPDGRFVAFTLGPDVVIWDRLRARTPPIVAGSGFNPALSRNGHFVVFQSDAELVEGDNNGLSDVYRFHRADRTLLRVSVDAQGRETALDHSFDPAISASGRFVAFSSAAGDLVLGDLNHGTNDRTSLGLDINEDIFVKDLRTGAIVRANVDEDRIEANGTSYSPSLSANGKVIAFVTDDANLLDPAPGNQNGPGDTVVVTEVDFRVPRPADIPGDPAGAASIGRNFAPVLETGVGVPLPDDQRSLNFTLRNTIDRQGDQDWFRVSLFAGKTYEIDLEGRPTRQGTLDDPLLHVFRAKAPGQIPDPGPFDDDGGVGLNAKLVFQPPVDGTYFISAEGFGAATGTYRLLVVEQ